MATEKLSRREQATRTRLRILAAAHASFVTRGYTGTRMVDVAEAAGVAVQTVYFTFHTKPELLAACYDLAVLGGLDAPPPPEQAWHRAAMEATTPEASVEELVAGTTAICGRIAVLGDTLRAAVHEPEAVAVHERGERLRRGDFEKVVAHWAERFGLRPGLSAGAATDLLLTLSGPACYRQLVLDHGWSEDDYRGWLGEALLGLLATAPPRTTAGSTARRRSASRTGTTPR